MPGGQQYGPWILHGTTAVTANAWFAVYKDEITDPPGRSGRYDWVDTRDQVRVAAVTEDGRIYLVEQYHYLPRRSLLQAPGGTVDDGESADASAARELAEETGLAAGRWRSYPAVWPLPGITPARVHLFVAQDLRQGPARQDITEADLTVTVIPISTAVDAVCSGRIGCAASAQLVLAVAGEYASK